MPKIHVIRDETEVRQRYIATAQRYDAGNIEADEYLRMLGDEPETWKEIDRSGKQMLAILARYIAKRSKWTVNVIAQYVAWKWLLGHPDADTFHGAHEKPVGYDPRTTYVYLRNQIESGEWDRLTQQAIQGLKGKMIAL